MGGFSNTLPVGTNLHQYEIISVLGRGGFGVTYLAKDTMLEMEVAIKEFFPVVFGVERDGSGGVIMKDPKNQELLSQAQERFVNEARHIARFHNANIVKIFNFFKANNTAYLVMEFMKGESLSQKFRQQACRKERELMKVLLPLMKALRLLHNEGLVHRDVKPGNIYIRQDGSPLLLDFGAARQFISEHSCNLTTLLTPGYAPIEQYFGKKTEHGPWTDIYSLAAVLYAGVVGKPPSDAMTRSNALLQTGTDSLIPATQIGLGRYSQSFLAAIDWALKMNVKERPQTMDGWLSCFSLKNEPSGIVTMEDNAKNRAYVLRIISDIAFFRDFSDAERHSFVSNYTRIQKCVAGVFIVKEGSTDSSFYILLSGSVSVMKNGNPAPLAELVPGAIFGEMSFLANMPRTANVVANDRSLFIQIDKKLMDVLGAEIREKIKDRIIDQLLKRMSKMNQLLHHVIKSSYVLLGTNIQLDDSYDPGDVPSRSS